MASVRFLAIFLHIQYNRFSASVTWRKPHALNPTPFKITVNTRYTNWYHSSWITVVFWDYIFGLVWNDHQPKDVIRSSSSVTSSFYSGMRDDSTHNFSTVCFRVKRNTALKPQTKEKMSKLQPFRNKRSQCRLLHRWLTTVHKRSYCELLESDKNTQGETNSVRVKSQWGATIIFRWFLWSGSTGSWGSGSGRRGPGRLLGHYGIELLTGPLGTHGESPVAQLPRAHLHWNRWRSLPALQRPCEQLFTRTTWVLFTLGEMSRVFRPRSRQVIGCAERTTDQSAPPTTSVKVTIWFKSVYKDILVG